MSVNRQVDSLLKPRGPKQHELEMLEMVRSVVPAGFSGRVLDVGCGNGNFLKLMAGALPKASLNGIDLSEDCVRFASENLKGLNCRLIVADALGFQPAEPYDIVIAAGVLSIFEDVEAPLRKWCSWVNPGGHLFIFGRFNSRDIDTVIRFRNNVVNHGWEGGMTAFSTATVKKVVETLGHVCEFKRFELNMDIAETDNPVHTFTVKTADGRRMILSGANTVCEYYFLHITVGVGNG